MKDKKKKNRLWSGEFKLKVVLDIIENELSYIYVGVFRDQNWKKYKRDNM